MRRQRSTLAAKLSLLCRSRAKRRVSGSRHARAAPGGQAPTCRGQLLQPGVRMAQKPLSRANSAMGNAPGDAVNVQVILRCRCAAAAAVASRRRRCSRGSLRARALAAPCCRPAAANTIARAALDLHPLNAPRRPPSREEVAARTPQVVKCDEAMRAVTLSQSVPNSKQVNTRTYHFDKVAAAAEGAGLLCRACCCQAATRQRGSRKHPAAACATAGSPCQLPPACWLEPGTHSPTRHALPPSAPLSARCLRPTPPRSGCTRRPSAGSWRRCSRASTAPSSPVRLLCQGLQQ